MVLFFCISQVDLFYTGKRKSKKLISSVSFIQVKQLFFKMHCFSNGRFPRIHLFSNFYSKENGLEVFGFSGAQTGLGSYRLCRVCYIC